MDSGNPDYDDELEENVDVDRGDATALSALAQKISSSRGAELLLQQPDPDLVHGLSCRVDPLSSASTCPQSPASSCGGGRGEKGERGTTVGSHINSIVCQQQMYCYYYIILRFLLM